MKIRADNPMMVVPGEDGDAAAPEWVGMQVPFASEVALSPASAATDVLQCSSPATAACHPFQLGASHLPPPLVQMTTVQEQSLMRTSSLLTGAAPPAAPVVLGITGALRDQPLEVLLDTAVNLASSSMTRTMAAFQSACAVWALASDSAATSAALDLAEASMAHTLNRMHIAQQLAAVLLARKVRARTMPDVVTEGQSGPFQLSARHLKALEAVAETEEEGEEEVCSSWYP